MLPDNGHKHPCRPEGVLQRRSCLSVQTCKLPTRHRKAPEDIQVIGYDGLRQPDDRQYMCSTIEQPVRTMAEMCVEILFSGNQALRSSLFCLPVKYIAGPTTKDRPEQYK